MALQISLARIEKRSVVVLTTSDGRTRTPVTGNAAEAGRRVESGFYN
jgi:hypothetical protein